MAMTLVYILQVALRAIVTSTVVYALFLAVLTIPYFQNHVIYLHGVSMTWFKDVNYPEQWGFLHNQVTPFYLSTPDGEILHAWHVLPLGQYRRNEQALLAEPFGASPDITKSLSFQLLRDDPDALLVLYFHGAAGTLGSGYRPPCYRALSAGAPDKIHVVAIDYRGFGQSTGTPSERGLMIDAHTLTTWATDVAGIPPERIVLFGQSIGTAVAVSLVHDLTIGLESAETSAARRDPIIFAGMVLTASMADVQTLTATYSIAGTIPLLSPVAQIPALFTFLNRFILSKWPSKTKVGEFVRHCENRSFNRGKAGSHSANYYINFIHGQDDWDIPWSHSEILYWHAVNATSSGISFEELEKQKEATRTNLGAGGWSMEWQTDAGTLREDILKNGLHDVIMSYPALSLAVLRAFDNGGQL